MSEENENKNDMLSLLGAVGRIEERLGKIEKRLEVIEGSTNKMDSHINFVEHTYMYLRTPLSLLQKMATMVTGKANDGETSVKLLNNADIEHKAKGEEFDAVDQLPTLDHQSNPTQYYYHNTNTRAPVISENGSYHL